MALTASLRQSLRSSSRQASSRSSRALCCLRTACVSSFTGDTGLSGPGEQQGALSGEQSLLAGSRGPPPAERALTLSHTRTLPRACPDCRPAAVAGVGTTNTTPPRCHGGTSAAQSGTGPRVTVLGGRRGQLLLSKHPSALGHQLLPTTFSSSLSCVHTCLFSCSASGRGQTRPTGSSRPVRQDLYITQIGSHRGQR